VTERVQASLESALADLMGWLDAAQAPFMIIGGVAASVLGRPRLTQDVDALVILSESDCARAMRIAAQHNILPRIDDALQFAKRSRVLLMRHATSGVDIDVTLGDLVFERAAIERSENRVVGGMRLRLPRVEDLLVMKAIARRPKDVQDLEGLLAAHPEADVEAARRWVREFATAMSMPDMLEEFDALLARRASRP
jgi:predicted nucleotidyltransferase